MKGDSDKMDTQVIWVSIVSPAQPGLTSAVIAF
jgi:hypothetical protein